MADVEWNSIKDFSPGIYHNVSPNHAPGCAQEDKTFRCHSGKDGMLLPLPKMTNTITSDPLLTVGALTSEEYRITGLMVNDPVYDPGDPYAGIYQNNSEIWVGFEWWDDDDTGHINMRVQRYKHNLLTSPVWEVIGTRIYDQAFDPAVRPRKTEFVTMRSNSLDPSMAGPVVVAWVMSGWAQMFPDDTTPSVASTRYIPGDNVDGIIEHPAAEFLGVDGLVSHQGRAVIFPLTVLPLGAADQVYTTNEGFYWTDINNLTVRDDTYSTGEFLKAVASYDNPTGYQVYESNTADELLLIKARGGAIVISGNLNDFQVTTKQNVRGTGLSMNRGTNSPLGFVYPTDGGGVWLWEGGDISTSLTDHLDADFWRPPAVSPANGIQSENEWGYQNSQCSDWNQFVMFPNNWLWDTDHKGWWKIADQTDFVIHRWAQDWRGLICYGAPSGFTTDTDPVLYEFNKVVLADSYSWQSHPLTETMERAVEVRELILVASGAGTVRVTARTAEDQTGQTLSFTIDETFSPNMIAGSVSVRGSHLTFEIQSTGTGEDAVAPTVHELKYGTIPYTMTPRAASLVEY